MNGITMCDYLNIHPRIIEDTNIGGASFLAHLMQATAFINAGLMKVGLITYAQTAFSR